MKNSKLESKEVQEKIIRYYKDEYKDYLIYKNLAKIDNKNSKILEKLASQELKHHKFWKKFLKEKIEVKLNKFYFYFLLIIKLFFGLKFLIKLLEINEKRVIKEYKNFLKFLKGKDKEKLKKIIKDKEFHENFLISRLEDPFFKYSGFIVLGLADAIIEINGVHAGFLGLTSQTIVAGLAGLIVGFSASISMAIAAFLQAKQDEKLNSKVAGILTGVSYMLSVIILALPYFLIKDMIIAFSLSVFLSILMLAFFNFYSSITMDKNFFREFMESVLLIFIVTALSFILGEFLKNYFNLETI